MTLAGDATGRTERLCGRRVGRRVECEDGRSGKRVGLSLASRKLHLRAHHSHLAPAHSFGVTCTSRGRGQCRRPRKLGFSARLLLLRSRAAASPRALGSRSVAVQAAVAALVVLLVGGHLHAAAAGGAGGEGRRSTRARAQGGGVSARRCAHLALLARRRYGAAELRVLRAVVRAVLAAAALARLALGVLLGAAGHCGGERGAAGREGRRGERGGGGDTTSNEKGESNQAGFHSTDERGDKGQI